MTNINMPEIARAIENAEQNADRNKEMLDAAYECAEAICKAYDINGQLHRTAIGLTVLEAIKKATR